MNKGLECKKKKKGKKRKKKVKVGDRTAKSSEASPKGSLVRKIHLVFLLRAVGKELLIGERRALPLDYRTIDPLWIFAVRIDL